MITILDEPAVYSNIQTNSNHASRLEKIRSEAYSVSDNYLEFGEDYYDNKDVPQGFGGYRYDGRYSTCAREICDKVDFDCILDFGCAKGYLLFEFYKLSKKIVGVDLSDYARKNAKKEVQSYLYKNIREINDNQLSKIEIILTRDVLPHLTRDDLLSTLSFIEQKCTNLKMFYIEIVTADNEISRCRLKDWDPTHNLLLSKKEWGGIFNDYNMPFDVFYKKLF